MKALPVCALVHVLGAAVLCAHPAFAQENDRNGPGSPLEDHFRFSAGLWSVTTRTDLRLDADNGTQGTALSAENDLGLRDKSDMANVEAQLRLRKRHRVRFNYFALGRRANTTLTRQLSFGDDVYQVNDVVDSDIDIRDFSTTYSYAFLSRERFELAASLALHLMEFNAQAAVAARNIDEEESQTGPLPAFGLEATLRLTDRIHVEARGEYLSRRVDDFEGHFKNLRGAVVYRFNRNIAAGAAYNDMDIDVLSEDPGDAGRFRFANDGGELFFRLSF